MDKKIAGQPKLLREIVPPELDYKLRDPPRWAVAHVLDNLEDIW